MNTVEQLNTEQRELFATKLGAAMKAVATDFDIDLSAAMDSYTTGRSVASVSVREAANCSVDTVRNAVGWGAQQQFTHYMDCAVEGTQAVEHIDTSHNTAGLGNAPGSRFPADTTAYIFSTRNPFGMLHRWMKVHGEIVQKAQEAGYAEHFQKRDDYYANKKAQKEDARFQAV